MERAHGALCSLIRELGIEEQFTLHRIRDAWETLFGEPLCAHMYPVDLRNSQLLINVDSPAWLQQITFYKTEIIGKLMRFGVTDARFKTGKIEKRKKPPVVVPGDKKLASEDAFFLENLCSSIKDNELKNGIRRAAVKALSSPKQKT